MSNLICIAQLNPIVGDVEYNKNKAIECIQSAKQKKADLVVFPELFLLGCPFGDILSRYPHIARQCEKALNEIKKYCENISVLIGYPEINKNNFEKPYYNSICYIKNASIERSIRKTLCANYCEFNDYRYFESADVDIDNRIIELNGEKLGIAICEDSWNDFDFFERNFYKVDPISSIAPHVDVIICPSSSSSRERKVQLRHNLIKHITKKHSVRYIYVNQVGANDEIVYDGLSCMFNEHGAMIANAKAFEEEYLFVDSILGGDITPLIKGLELNLKKEFNLNYENDLERTYRAILFAIKEYFSKNGFKRAVLGLSGGLDSSICAVLLADALGRENVLGVSMPSKITSSNSKNDAYELAQNLGIHFIEVPIKETQELLNKNFEAMFSKIDWCKRYTSSYTKDNIQARSRATILWGISNEYPKTLPIATSDKSETYMGYATINGDMSGGYAPIADVTKTKLFALARWLNKNREIKDAIPKSVILKPPGAELAINPETGKTLTAEEALMPYEFLDEVIWRIENYNQTIDDMLKEEFVYEKHNSLENNQKQIWLEKFFKRLNSALYKWYITAPAPIVDAHSINKAEYRQSIVSNINYRENIS